MPDRGELAMRGTAVDHPLVLEYLRQLDTALKALPVKNARELREQVTAHLDDAVSAGADDEAVAKILGRLGSPGDLAAEAIAVAGRRPWPARLGWRVWALIAAAVILIAAVISYVVVIQSTAPLVAQGTSAWWYPQDYTRAVITSADGATQTTVPIRPGQRQGFVIELFNYTGLTQTVLGTTADYTAPDNGSNTRIGVSTVDSYHGNTEVRTLRYTLPVSIPPNQSRAVRVLWTSNGCLPKEAESGTDELDIRVRVGWITRTETIQLNYGFFLGPGGGPCHE